MSDTLVADLIRQRRKRKGLSQFELGEKLGVARNTISRWENADPRSKPEEDSRRRLAKILGGSPTEYEWTDEDFERAAHLQRVRDEAAAYVRRLLAGEQ